MKKICTILAAIAMIAACKPDSGSEVSQEEVPVRTRLRTWIMDSLDDYGTYFADGSQSECTLYMAVGETEHIQLKIFTKDETPLSVLRQKTNREIDFQCRSFAPFNGIDDEVLIPCTSAAPDTSGVIHLYLSFTANRSASPNSTYSETIALSSDTSVSSIKVKIVTGSAVLPVTPSVPSVFGIWPDAVDDRKAMTDLLLDYRISPYFFYWESDGHSIECTSSPYEYGDPLYWDYLCDERFAAIAMPYHEIGEGTLKEMMDRTKELGIFKKTYYYVIDEPSTMAEYAVVEKASEKIHGLDPDARILTTFYRGPQEGPHQGDIMAAFSYLDLGRSDIFSVVYDTDASMTPAYVSVLHDNQQYWGYVTSVNYPGISTHSNRFENRAVMWRLFADGGDGFLYWAVNFFDTLHPITYHLTRLDASLVYPGNEFGSEGLCVSVRLERWRDSQEECELLRAYEEREGREAAMNLLKTVYGGPKSVCRDINTINEFHKKLVGAI